VKTQEGDPRSLLNHYRRLIHLRAENSALSAGTLIPLTATNDAVAAYLRRDGNRTVLVVINLGAKPLSGVTISSAAGVLPMGRYAVREAFDRRPATRLRVGSNGRVRGYGPFRTLGPLQAYLLELSSPAR
jgi:hypothetical protein